MSLPLFRLSHLMYDCNTQCPSKFSCFQRALIARVQLAYDTLAAFVNVTHRNGQQAQHAVWPEKAR